jgi:hypothetical protein
MPSYFAFTALHYKKEKWHTLRKEQCRLWDLRAQWPAARTNQLCLESLSKGEQAYSTSASQRWTLEMQLKVKPS